MKCTIAKRSRAGVSCKVIPNGAPPMGQNSLVIPSNAHAAELFDRMDEKGLGWVGLADVKGGIPLLNANLNLDLVEGDAERLYRFLQDTVSGPVGRRRFCKKLRELCGTLQRLTPHMSIRQMKTVLVAAFIPFDKDHDGRISPEEFIATMEMLGVNLSTEDCYVLHRFLACDSVMQQKQLVSELPLMEQWGRALNRFGVQARNHYGWDAMENVLSRFTEAISAPESMSEKLPRVQKAAWAGAEDLCNVAELIADAVGAFVFTGYLYSAMEQGLMTEAIESLTPVDLVPIGLCLALFPVNLIKEIDELVPKEMTPDEAVLYARHFEKHGFTQAEFRRILTSPGCQWRNASSGEVLNKPDDPSIKLIVRGHMVVSVQDAPGQNDGVPLGPGSSIGGEGFVCGKKLWTKEMITAVETVAYISWKPAGLRRCIEHDMELSLRMDGLLADTFATNLRAMLQLRQQRRQLAPIATTNALFLGPLDLLEPGAPTGAPITFRKVYSSMGVSQVPAVDEMMLVEFFMRANRELELDMTRDLCTQLFVYLDVDGDGVVCPDEFRLKLTELERCLNCLSGIKMKDLMTLFVKGMVEEEDLVHLMGYIDRSIGVGTSDKDRHRLFQHISDGSGNVTLGHFVSKLEELEGCFQDLGGMSTQELLTLMHRAFDQFDLNSDGVISMGEFVLAVKRLQIPISEKQAMMLYGYLDSQGDGSLNLQEWIAGNTLPMWLDALKMTVETQATRTGVSRMAYVAETFIEIAKGPDDLGVKARLVFARLWDVTSDLADVAKVVTDSAGVFAALSGIWLEVSGIDSVSEINEVDLLPFILFLGISGVQLVRHFTEVQISDLPEREALVYATVFEKAGFSVMEFQRLISYGEVCWEELAPGETLEEATGGAGPGSWHFRVIVRGSCQVLDRAGRSVASVGSGGLLDTGQDLGNEASRVGLSGGALQASEPTTVITWDGPLLESELKRDKKVRVKLTRAKMTFMVDHLLRTQDLVRSRDRPRADGDPQLAPLLQPEPSYPLRRPP